MADQGTSEYRYVYLNPDGSWTASMLKADFNSEAFLEFSWGLVPAAYYWGFYVSN
jgi:hypothetical protein